jgi:hypothetical protein
MGLAKCDLKIQYIDDSSFVIEDVHTVREENFIIILKQLEDGKRKQIEIPLSQIKFIDKHFYY